MTLSSISKFVPKSTEIWDKKSWKQKALEYLLSKFQLIQASAKSQRSYKVYVKNSDLLDLAGYSYKISNHLTISKKFCKHLDPAFINSIFVSDFFS